MLMLFADYSHLSMDRMSQASLGLPFGEEDTPRHVRSFDNFVGHLFKSVNTGTKGL